MDAFNPVRKLVMFQAGVAVQAAADIFEFGLAVAAAGRKSDCWRCTGSQSQTKNEQTKCFHSSSIVIINERAKFSIICFKLQIVNK